MTTATYQADCGSCLAFATIGAIEVNYNIQFGKSPFFSQKQLVDWDKISTACSDAQADKALNYLKYNGLAYDSNPYVSGLSSVAGDYRASSMALKQSNNRIWNLQLH